LFWALRGGGGGTYGVVTSITYQTYPTFPVITAFLTANFSSPDIAQNVTTEYIKLHPTISDIGWAAYLSSSNSSFFIVLIATDASFADTNATFLPFVQYVEEATGGLAQLTMTSFISFYEFYLDVFVSTNGTAGSQVEIASRLLPRSLADTDPAKAAKIMLSIDGGVAIK
jgi:FAD/FMN-containing dehydrogenase